MCSYTIFLDRLRELRNHFRDFGPLEQLESMLNTRKRPQSAADSALHANLQLLLQTPTAAGGSASRPALALNTIAVAVAMTAKIAANTATVINVVANVAPLCLCECTCHCRPPNTVAP